MRFLLSILAALIGLTATAGTNYLTTGAGTAAANGYFYPFTNGIYAGTNSFILSGDAGSVLSGYAQPSATNAIIYADTNGGIMYFPAPAAGGNIYAPRTNYGGTNVLSFYTAPSSGTNSATNSLLIYSDSGGNFVTLTARATNGIFSAIGARGTNIFGGPNAIISGNYWYIVDMWSLHQLYLMQPSEGYHSGHYIDGSDYLSDLATNGSYSIPDTGGILTSFGAVTNSQPFFISGTRVIVNLNGTLTVKDTSTTLATNNVILFASPALYFNPSANPAAGYWRPANGAARAPKLTQFTGSNPYAATNITENWRTNATAGGGEPKFLAWLATNPPAGESLFTNWLATNAAGITASVTNRNLVLNFTNGILSLIIITDVLYVSGAGSAAANGSYTRDDATAQANGYLIGWISDSGDYFGAGGTKAGILISETAAWIASVDFGYYHTDNPNNDPTTISDWAPWSGDSPAPTISR